MKRQADAIRLEELGGASKDYQEKPVLAEDQFNTNTKELKQQRRELKLKWVTLYSLYYSIMFDHYKHVLYFTGRDVDEKEVERE